MASDDHEKTNWGTAFRVFCLVGGLTLSGTAYLAPEWLAQYMSVDLAWTVGFILLLMLPATMVFQLGGGRMMRALRKSGRRAAITEAREALPEWARRHDLEFRASDEREKVGTVLGDLHGHKVFVDVDAGDVGARWREEFGGQDVDISTTPPPASHDLEAFDTGDERFDAVFQTRLGTEDAAEQFGESDVLRRELLGLWEAHEEELEEMNVDAEGVVCFLEPDSQYDVKVVAAVVDALVEMMQRVERIDSLEDQAAVGDRGEAE